MTRASRFPSIGRRRGDMAKAFLLTILITILAHQRALGEYCRFSRSSAIKGSCVFPCRCTDGCDTTTGDCLNGGQCEDGHPSGYRWRGVACQTGNVAYQKTTSQSSYQWSKRFPADRAVDGNPDPHIQNGYCAHPDANWGQHAWWMVDLEETFNIYHVTIYNRDENAERLDMFILSVGDSPDRTAHRQCASHNGRVASGKTVEVACNDVGQYLTFRREGADSDATALCEVVVIGHRHISCKHCPVGTSCNDVIGCDACARGKQQPDCIKACEDNTYDVNCMEECGHCKDNEPCDKESGICTNGCEMWYTTDLCKSFIRNPSFKTTDRPKVEDITSSSVVVSWSQANDVTSGSESHYYYIVWLGRRGGTFNNVSRQQGAAGLYELRSQITGLSFNTNYSVKIEPFRQQNERHQTGRNTQVINFKTNCTAPESPTIDTVTTSIRNGSIDASITVTWKMLINSGCDELVAVGALYKRQTSNNDQWSYKEAKQVTSTQLVITGLASDVYEVKLKAINNEGITATSKTVVAKLITGPRKPDMMTAGAGGNGAAVAAGVSVSVIVIIAVICVVIFIVLRRRRAEENKRETTNTSMSFSTGMQQDDGEENAGFETERVGDGDSREETEREKVAEPEYVNTQQVTRGVAVADIADYVEGKRRQDGFKSEFKELPSGIQANCTAAKKPQNKNKNRFQDIIAYDHTRVVLSVDKKQCDYINANYIKGYNNKKNAYIACQGPRDTTIEDMWRMVWQAKSNTIVMLANLLENGKEKCCKYWPEKNGRRSWGHFITESISEEKVADYVVRQFSLRNQETGEVRRIRQLHFTNWPDRGTPQYAYPLLAFRRKVHSFDRAIRGPLVVHCSAGVGRTGTFMAIDILIQQAAVEGKIDVFQCINQLRTQRMNLVQTLEQYVFVYQAMIESSQATVVPCSTLRQTFGELCRNRQIEQQFEQLSALKPLTKKGKCDALEPNNVGKNRNVDIIPDDQHRPYLLTPWNKSTNYINAVFVHGYKELNAYIVTQSPMASTVVDLWRLLADHESRTIVKLDDCDVTDDQCAIYWPTKEGAMQQLGPFQVQLMQTVVSATSNITVREFNLTKSGSNKESTTVVKQFQVTGVWSQGASLPSNKTVVLELLGLVEKWQQMNGNGPVTVHCSDGASRSGLACAAGYVLEHLKVEQEVDVFHAVQHIRTTRPQLVTDKEQYRFLYEIALEYMSQFDEYANFR